jgi:outer membrane protein TolC
VLACLLGACAGARETAVQKQLEAMPVPAPRAPAGGEPHPSVRAPDSLEGLIEAAMAQSPELRAAFHEYRARTLEISRARRLPDPKLTYGYFIRSVETRVGPQRHRIGISQTIPWPTSLSAGADAASARAQAAARTLDATRLALRLRVVRAYYTLWRLHHERAIEVEQLTLLRELGGAARAQLAAGRSSLAELAQLDLATSRRADRLQSIDEETRAAMAELVATIGLQRGDPLELSYPELEPALPAADAQALRARAAQHPLIANAETMAEASDLQARSTDAQSMPSFTVGLDYIETGDAMQAGVPDSGKDPIIAMVSVSLPVWGGSYAREVDARRADASSQRARADLLRDRASASVDQALSALRDSGRRVALHEATLRPQATAAYQSVTAAYAAGRSSIAAVLLAQRDLLEIRLEQVRAAARHAVAWAELEHAVGQPVARAPLDGRLESGGLESRQVESTPVDDEGVDK